MKNEQTKMNKDL